MVILWCKGQFYEWPVVKALSLLLYIFNVCVLFGVTFYYHGKLTDLRESNNRLKRQISLFQTWIGDMTENIERCRDYLGLKNSVSMRTERDLNDLFADIIKSQEMALQKACTNGTHICLTGEKGSPGVKGSTGRPGLKGDRGPPGVKGQTGPNGVKGDKGERGITGDKGTKGDNGIFGKKGEKGTSGIPGQKGEKGTSGTKGAAGQQGPIGPKGDEGLPGRAGTKGQLGAVGEPGVPGKCDDQQCECAKAPSIQVRNDTSPIKTQAGTPVYLTCNVTSYPAAYIIWELITPQEIVPISSHSETLVLSTSSTNDSGVYKCTARNFLGVAVQTFTVDIN